MSSTWIKDRHDLGVTNVGSDGSGTDLIGLMINRIKGVPQYRVLDGKLLADQIFTGAPSQEYTDPEEEILIAQSDFRAGYGLEVADPSDPKRYYSSIGADLRFKGMGLAGPVPTTITKASSVDDITDKELDVWTDANTLTDWTKSGTGTLAREATIKYSGTYSAKITAAAAAVQVIYQNLTNWTTGWRGVVVTFTCWCRCADANQAAIAIVDSVGNDQSTYHTGGDTWENLTVTRTIDAGATSLQFQIGMQSGSKVGYFDLVTIAVSSAALGTTTCFAEFNDQLYANFGKVLGKLNATGTAFTVTAILPVTITDLEPFTDDCLYIAQGLTASYYYMSTAEAITLASAIVTVNTFQFFKTVHGATPTLWGNTSAYQIRSNATPKADTWSGTTSVCSSYYAITELIQKAGALYIMTEIMPYYLSGATVMNDLAPELATLTSSTSGKNTKLYKSYLYIPCGAQGLLRTDGTTNEFINPAADTTNLPDFAGRVQALGYDEEYLFAVVDNATSGSTKVEVLAGSDENVDGVTQFRWHPIAEIPFTAGDCETAFVSSVFQKRLYITSDTAAQSLYYIALPTGYGNITADANRSFQNGSYFITPWYHGNFKTNQKAFIKLTVTLGHAYGTGTVYWSAGYEKIGDSSFTSIGDFKGTATNRMETKYIPLAGTDKPISTMMRFQFTATTDATTSTPILLQYTVSAILYPTIKTLISCQVICAEEIQTKQGVLEKNMMDTIITTLDNARNATYPLSIRDIDGATQTVKLLALPKDTPRYVVVSDEKGREKERIYNLLMQISPTS